MSPSEPIIEINSSLFLSGVNVSEDYEELKKHNINYIVNAAVEVPDSFTHLPEFVYNRLELQDHPSQNMCIVNVFENAFKTIGTPFSSLLFSFLFLGLPCNSPIPLR